jgi:hypothetical protein
MSYDIDLLTVVSEKDTYNRFKEHVKKHNVSSITLDIFNVLGEYWDNYPTRTKVDVNEFHTFFNIVRGKKLKDPALYEQAFHMVRSECMEDEPPIVKDISG